MKKWWDNEPWWLIVFALPVLQVKNLSLYMSALKTLPEAGNLLCPCSGVVNRAVSISVELGGRNYLTSAWFRAVRLFAKRTLKRFAQVAVLSTSILARR